MQCLIFLHEYSANNNLIHLRQYLSCALKATPWWMSCHMSTSHLAPLPSCALNDLLTYFTTVTTIYAKRLALLHDMMFRHPISISTFIITPWRPAADSSWRNQCSFRFVSISFFIWWGQRKFSNKKVKTSPLHHLIYCPSFKLFVAVTLQCQCSCVIKMNETTRLPLTIALRQKHKVETNTVRKV